MDPVILLIILNVLLYIASVISPEIVYNLGLWSGADFLYRPWGIITSLFMHGNFWHIFANMLTFFFFATTLRGFLGNSRMLLIYFVGGVVGGLFFVALAGSNTVAIGASGAVFALGGALALLRPRLRVMIFPIPAPMPLWVAMLVIFVILSFMPGVAWQSHLGGLLTGLALGYLFRRPGYR